jgi:hypothetical protein
MPMRVVFVLVLRAVFASSGARTNEVRSAVDAVCVVNAVSTKKIAPMRHLNQGVRCLIENRCEENQWELATWRRSDH